MRIYCKLSFDYQAVFYFYSHGIPKSTLYDHLKRPPARSYGRPPVLSEIEENYLEKCLLKAAEFGFPFDKLSLRCVVADYLNQIGKVVTQFRDNEPGVDWVRSFLRRHPTLRTRNCENLARSKAIVTRKTVEKFYRNFASEVEGFYVEPQFIINYDETNITDDPGRKKVITRRGSKHAHRMMNSTKTSHSVMFSGTASGVLLPIYLVFKAEHLYDSWTTGGPKGARYNRSKSGWFDSRIFAEWFRTIVLPYCRKHDPENLKWKILIGDNLASHISVEVIDACEIHRIKFILLPPNTTSLMQPLDLAYFRPLKCKWRNVLEQWKKGNRKESSLPKSEVPKLLRQTLCEINSKDNLIAGFRTSGIYPLDAEKPLSRMPPDPVTPISPNSCGSAWLNSFTKVLHTERYGNAQPLKQRKKKLMVSPGKSISRKDLNFGETSSEDESEWNVDEPADEESDSSSVSGIDELPPVFEPQASCSKFLASLEIDKPIAGSSKMSSTPVSETAEVPVLTVDDIVVNDFLMVNLKYDEGTKKESIKTFMASVITVSKKQPQKLSCKFLKKSMKTTTFFYKDIPDIFEVSLSDVVQKVKLIKVRRGHHDFGVNVYHNCTS